MRKRTSTRPGTGPLIRSLLTIAVLLGVYLALQPLLAPRAEGTALSRTQAMPDDGWRRSA